MKPYAAVAIYLVVVLCQVPAQESEASSQLLRLADECLQDLEIDREQFAYTPTTFVAEDDEPTDRQTQCFSHCLMVKVGIVDDEGQMDAGAADVVLNVYDGDAVDFDRCAAIGGADKCERSSAVRRCIRQELAKQKNYGMYMNMSGQCLAELNLAANLVDASSAMAAIESAGELPQSVFADRNMQCYLKCIMQKMGLFSEQGELIVEAASATIKEMAGAEDVDLKKCAEVAVEDACERAVAIRNCILEDIAVKTGAPKA